MGRSVRVKRHIESESIVMPELREFVGRDVEIVVRELEVSERNGASKSLQGSVLWYEDPFGPAVPEDDWEAAN